jgi:Skp family chaperone for outer membrane proteins
MRVLKGFLLALFSLVVVTGCNLGVGEKTAIIDLTAVSKAMGLDVVIEQRMEQARLELNNQLTTAAKELEQQLVDKKAEMGKKLSEEEKAQLGQFALNANQQIQKNKMMAQQKAQEFKMGLIMEWRKDIQPAVEKLAKKHNAKTVLVLTPSVMWFDESIDITADVIDELRANPVETPDVSSEAVEETAKESSVDE